MVPWEDDIKNQDLDAVPAHLLGDIYLWEYTNFSLYVSIMFVNLTIYDYVS